MKIRDLFYKERWVKNEVIGTYRNELRDWVMDIRDITIAALSATGIVFVLLALNKILR